MNEIADLDEKIDALAQALMRVVFELETARLIGGRRK